MQNTATITLIDGDTQCDYELTWGCLTGWDDENGSWMIELITANGLIRFKSSNTGSAIAVAKVREILRSDEGLQNPNCYIGIVGGCLTFLEANKMPIDPDCLFDFYVHSSMASIQKAATTLAYFFGSHDALITSVKTLHHNGGIELLCGYGSFTFENNVVLSWNIQLNSKDICALCAIYSNCVDIEWSDRSWRATKEEFSDSLNKLTNLNFKLGPSPLGRETLSFHLFEMIADDLPIFDETLKLLFFHPIWAIDRIARGF